MTGSPATTACCPCCFSDNVAVKCGTREDGTEWFCIECRDCCETTEVGRGYRVVQPPADLPPE